MTQFTDQQIDTAFDSAPEEVKEVILNGTLSQHVIEIAEKNQLHIDLMEPLAAHGRNMLIGLLPPTQFVTELKAAGITDQIANAILQDLNEQVFKPLHEKIRAEKAAVPTPEPTKAVVPEVPKPQALPPVPTPPRPVALEPKLPTLVPVPPSALTVPLTPVPPPPPAQAVPPLSQAMVTPQVPQMRTMAHDVEILKEGKVPTPAPRPTPVASPAPSTPHESTTSVPTHKEVSDTLKQYGVDPYREPVE